MKKATIQSVAETCFGMVKTAAGWVKTKASLIFDSNNISRKSWTKIGKRRK